MGLAFWAFVPQEQPGAVALSAVHGTPSTREVPALRIGNVPVWNLAKRATFWHGPPMLIIEAAPIPTDRLLKIRNSYLEALQRIRDIIERGTLVEGFGVGGDAEVHRPLYVLQLDQARLLRLIAKLKQEVQTCLKRMRNANVPNGIGLFNWQTVIGFQTRGSVTKEMGVSQ